MNNELFKKCQYLWCVLFVRGLFLWFGLSFWGSGISSAQLLCHYFYSQLATFEAPNLFPQKNEIKIIWLHTCPVLDCLLLYDRTGRWNHMIITSVKVYLLFLIVDIISNCQTIIIDNYTKNRRNFVCEMNTILMISTNLW